MPPPRAFSMKVPLLKYYAGIIPARVSSIPPSLSISFAKFLSRNFNKEGLSTCLSVGLNSPLG